MQKACTLWRRDNVPLEPWGHVLRPTILLRSSASAAATLRTSASGSRPEVDLASGNLRLLPGTRPRDLT
jgi:hypothetical protein